MMQMSSVDYRNHARMPFGIAAVDIATMGGFPIGGSTVISGQPRSGKSTLLYYAIAAFLVHDERDAALFLAEDKFDVDYASSIFACEGLDPQRALARLHIYIPEFLEDCLDEIQKIITEPEYDHIGFIGNDSLGSMVSQAREDDSYTDERYPLEPKKINLFMAATAPRLAKRRIEMSPVTIMHITHEYQGTAPGPKAPQPVKVAGGTKLAYLSHLRLRTLRPQYIPAHNPVQVEVRVVVTGNRGPAYEEAVFRVNQRRVAGNPPGYVDQMEFVWTAGLRCGYITGGGGRWSVGGETVGGKFEAFEHWRRRGDLYVRDRKAIVETMIAKRQEEDAEEGKRRRREQSNEEES